MKAAIALLASTYVNASYYPPTATYKPYTNITVSLELDLEQAAFEEIISNKTLEDFAAGLTYYQNSNLKQVDVDYNFISLWGFESPTLHFMNYYGNVPITEFVTAALSGGTTKFKDGNEDFSSYVTTAPDVIEQCAKKGSSYVVQYVAFLKQIEKSVCAIVPDIKSWDTGVAYYTGSLEGVDGTPGTNDYFGYSLADRRGKNFKTLGDGGDSTTDGEPSKANIDIMRLFTAGGIQLSNNNILQARDTARKIVSVSRIPLTQGTLRYAWRVQNAADSGTILYKAKAEGAAFAAGILPSVAHCNKACAKTIYDNMKLDATSTDFLTVKKAFENVYTCLGITCEEVGGLFIDGEYVAGGDPANCQASPILQEDHNLRVQE